jgi:hypothetical protein
VLLILIRWAKDGNDFEYLRDWFLKEFWSVNKFKFFCPSSTSLQHILLQKNPQKCPFYAIFHILRKVNWKVKLDIASAPSPDLHQMCRLSRG